MYSIFEFEKSFPDRLQISVWSQVEGVAVGTGLSYNERPDLRITLAIPNRREALRGNSSEDCSVATDPLPQVIPF
jgi:hypothetical protein